MKTIQEAVASVQNAPSSIFTKEDVINLLNKLKAPKVSIGKEQIEELCEKIYDHIKDNANGLSTDEVVDTGTAEFELYGNEIQLSSVDIDTKGLADSVVDGLADVIEEFFEEDEESDDEEETNS